MLLYGGYSQMSTDPLDSFQRFEKRIAIRVNTSAERAIRRNHPWVYSDSITYQSIKGEAGQLAAIFNSKHKFLAIGLFDPFADIRIRILESHNPVPITKQWLTNKIIAAKKVRIPVSKNTNGYRIVHGENDGLPGLVIDKYADVAVIKIYTLAWFPHIQNIVSSLLTIRPWTLIVLRISRGIQTLAKSMFQLYDGDTLFSNNPKHPITFQENELIFEVDPFKGHKTGFYLDQRDNRLLLMKYAKENDILNLFSYTGAFSIYAAKGGAKRITNVDISQLALNAINRNIAYNKSIENVRKARIINKKANVFSYLTTKNPVKHDIVIVDPPSFASKQEQVEKSLRSYKVLTQNSIPRIKRGGMLVQSSCTNKVPAELFFQVVLNTIAASKRRYHVLEKTYQPIDHPIRFKEGAYLKTLFVRLD